MKNTDSHIIELLLQRSEAALEMIQECYGRLVRAIAFNMTKSDTVAEECLNDTLLDIWNSIPPEKPDSVGSYACMIARRRSVDRVRSLNAQKRYMPDTEYVSVYEELAFLDDFSEDVVNGMTLNEVIDDFLDGLSLRDREIFMSRYYDFESMESIASRLHMSKNALSVRLLRIKKKLSERLGKEGIGV